MKLTRKHQERLQAEGVDLLETLKEVYREANQAFAQELLAATARCRNFSAYEPVVLEDQPPACGCPDCVKTRALMTTHLRSIAMARLAVDHFMKKLAAKQGRVLRPIP